MAMDDSYMSRVPSHGTDAMEATDDFKPFIGSPGKRITHSRYSVGITPEAMRCKRRITYNQTVYGLPLPSEPPAAVVRRNERERNRVKLVNLGFATLRDHVPNGAKNKKMSKVETLRSAVEYIRQLQQVLRERQAGLGPYSNEENCNPRNSGPQSAMSSSCSVASSPAPSYASDSSYEALSPEDEELLDFTSWFS